MRRSAASRLALTGVFLALLVAALGLCPGLAFADSGLAPASPKMCTVTFDTGCEAKVQPIKVPAGTVLVYGSNQVTDSSQVNVYYVDPNQSHGTGTDLTITAPEGLDKKRRFVYWSITSDRYNATKTADTGMNYTEGSGRIQFPYTVTSDVTFYAAWYNLDYNTSFVQNVFRYYPNGGTGSMDPAPSTAETNQILTPAQCTFTRPGYEFVRWSTFPDGSGASYKPGVQYFTSSWAQPLYAIWEAAPDDSAVMNRLYNKYTGEHLYTSSAQERDTLVNAGWTYEGDGWKAPKTSNTPVYRLYNPYAPGGDHHYTTSVSERDNLVSLGWKSEGTGWYSDDAQSVPLYRQYNPYAEVGTHNYTTSKDENDKLVSLGWRAEGVAWYGVK